MRHKQLLFVRLPVGYPSHSSRPYREFAIFALSRISGWTTHVMEQYADNKLIRPRAEYVGPGPRDYVAVDDRA